jgi:uncharacterized protein
VRERILGFVQSLREGGVEVSVAETLDAVRAVAVAGVERDVLREALAAALVKDEADRPAFDRCFDVAFPLSGRLPAPTRRRGRRAGGEPAAGPGGRGDGDGRGRRPSPRDDPEPFAGGDRGENPPSGTRRSERSDRPGDAPRRGRAARTRRLLTMPLQMLDARDVAEARELARELGRRLRGRLARRERRERRGRLDFRRTIRTAVATGGVPVRLRFRGRRPGPPDLVALCDLSGSVAAASELLLALIAPAADYFRRVHLFAYVDRLCPVSIERGHVAPGGRLDLHARSDFGRVLQDLREERPLLTPTTILLVLGDARNNRLPPRADLLRAVRERVQRLVWVVPEPAARWNTGDSVLARYAPACDAVVEGVTLGALVRAVRALV